MKAAIFYDCENINGDIEFIFEQIKKGLPEDIEITDQIAYGNWMNVSKSKKADFFEMGIDMVDVCEYSGFAGRPKHFADFKMAINIMELVLSDNPPDAIIIASGDGSFLAIIEELNGKGIWTVVAGTKANTNVKLRTEAARYIPIKIHKPILKKKAAKREKICLPEGYLMAAEEPHKAVAEIMAALYSGQNEERIEKGELYFSSFCEIIKQQLCDIEPKRWGYGSASEFVRASFADTEFCLASDTNKAIIVVKRNQLPPNAKQMDDVARIQIHSAKTYLHVANINERFSMNKLKYYAKMVSHRVDTLEEELLYIDIMKSAGILDIENRRIKRNYYLNSLMIYISSAMTDTGIEPCKEILSQIRDSFGEKA